MFLIPMNVWIYLESLRVCMVVVTELFFHFFIVTKSKSKKSLINIELIMPKPNSQN